MTRKKTKRYRDGGEIVVSGNRPNMFSSSDAQSNLDYMLPTQSKFDTSDITGGDGGGGGRGDSALRSLPRSTPSTGPRITPTAIRQPRSTLGALTGTAAPRGYGLNLSGKFKKGGKVEKMAKGGSVSSASKRADGCATKGKTKGRFV